MSSEGTAEKTPPAGNRRYQRQGSSSHGEPGTSEALDTETGRTVALRTFEKTSDPLALARFHREADLLRRLDHPGVVRVLDAGVDEGAPFLVLELQKGKTLAEWVAERKRLAEGHALALIAELARALAYAHAKGALSIDLSPENVVVVLEHETGPRPVLGTGDLLHAPRSRAPELGGREAGKGDERALVFDLGSLLHFCLTGSAPLDGLSADERARKLEAGIGSPEGTSPPIASVLVSALRTRPEERPATVAAFGEALEVARARLRATMRRGPEEAPFPGPPPSSGAFGVVRPKLLWPGRLKRAAGLVALAGVAVVGAFGTNVLLERARRSRALGLLTAAEGKLPKEEAAAASRALEIVPGLEEAYAFRALARAQAGDLDGAENDVASAPGVKSAAARARAWILLRRGHDVDALSLIEKTPFKEDHDRLAFAAGRSDLVANRSGLRFLLATRGELLPSQEAMDPSPRLAGEVALRRAIFRGAAGSAFELLSRAIDEAPGTLDAHEALLLRARMEAVELDDEAVQRDLARALDAPPHGNALALQVKERLERVLAGNDGTGEHERNELPSDLVDRAAAYFARETARAELERHRLTGKAPELARATKRLRRALALSPGDESTRVLYARALERRSHENAASLAKLAIVLEKCDAASPAALEAVKIRLVLGDQRGARDALARIEEKRRAEDEEKAKLHGARAKRLLVGLGAVLLHDRSRAAAFFGRESLPADEGARAEKAALAFVLERPFDAASDLTSLLAKETTPAAHLDLAAALCASDPATALAHLVKATPGRASGEALAILDAAALSLGQDEKDIASALAGRGLSPEEVKTGTALVRAERTLAPPWKEPTFAELDRAWKAGELDPLLVSSAHDLAPLRPDVRLEKLIRALER